MIDSAIAAVAVYCMDSSSPYCFPFKHNTPLDEKVSMLTHIYPHKARRKIEVIIYKITRQTAHFMCGLMSDLLICTCL